MFFWANLYSIVLKKVGHTTFLLLVQVNFFHTFLDAIVFE